MAIAFENQTYRFFNIIRPVLDRRFTYIQRLYRSAAMTSAAATRPSGAMTSAVSLWDPEISKVIADSSPKTRSTQFGNFNTGPGRHNSDDRTPQPSTLGGQTFGNGGSWQASGGIWGGNPIGSGFASAKRDASRSRGTSTSRRGLCTGTNLNS